MGRMIDDARKGVRETEGGKLGVYTHVQNSPAATWTINHNRGYRPDVTLFTTGGVKFEAGIAHPTVNQAVVTLKTALAGTARCC